MPRIFDPSELRKLYTPPKSSSGEDNGQITIIGGSSLFHGAPFFSLQAASRIVDMTFFASPERPLRDVAAHLKSRLHSFIWIPWEEVTSYVAKSDAVLMGPGFMRAHSEKTIGNENDRTDVAFMLTKTITDNLVDQFPNKKWVIDAGSLQTIDVNLLPKGAVLTPNKKEYKMLFGDKTPQEASREYGCIIVIKGEETLVVGPSDEVIVKGGNAGLTKGGTGDVMAGITVALLAKNDPFFAACCAAFIVKAAGDRLFTKRKYYYNSDDLAEAVPETLAIYVEK